MDSFEECRYKTSKIPEANYIFYSKPGENNENAKGLCFVSKTCDIDELVMPKIAGRTFKKNNGGNYLTQVYF